MMPLSITEFNNTLRASQRQTCKAKLNIAAALDPCSEPVVVVGY